MSGITNNTARQYNLKCVGKKGNRVTVRLAPGFNIVDDEHWQAFVSKDGKKVDPFVKGLSKAGLISYGKEQDDMELERDADTKSKSKSVQAPPSNKPNKPNKDDESNKDDDL